METKNLISGLVIGAALGTVAGLMFAPASGEKTRRKLLVRSLRLKNNLVDYVDDSMETLRNQFNQKIDQLAQRGQNAINRASEKIKV